MKRRCEVANVRAARVHQWIHSDVSETLNKFNVYITGYQFGEARETNADCDEYLRQPRTFLL